MLVCQRVTTENHHGKPAGKNPVGNIYIYNQYGITVYNQIDINHITILKLTNPLFNRRNSKWVDSSGLWHHSSADARSAWFILVPC